MQLSNDYEYFIAIILNTIKRDGKLIIAGTSSIEELKGSYKLAATLISSVVWQQLNKTSSVTPVISFTLPAPFRREQEVNDLCGKVKGQSMLLCQSRMTAAVCQRQIVCVRTGYCVWWYSVMRGKNNRGADGKQRQVSC